MEVSGSRSDTSLLEPQENVMTRFVVLWGCDANVIHTKSVVSRLRPPCTREKAI
jgi:hypothetical protein